MKIQMTLEFNALEQRALETYFERQRETGSARAQIRRWAWRILKAELTDMIEEQEREKLKQLEKGRC